MRTGKAAGAARRAALVALLGLSGCGGAEQPPPAAPPGPAAVIQPAPEPPPPALEPAKGPVRRLRFEELRPGQGPAATRSSTVVIRYVAGDARSAESLESTYEDGAPFEADLGARLLPPGLQRGVVGMREGARRRIEVPRRLSGQGRALVYVVELVDVL